MFARFQWLNNPQVVHVLSQFLKPPSRGRKGYDKVWLFRWLMYRQLMNCSYRDLESMTNIDYSTFIKFRKRLIARAWFQSVFTVLSQSIARHIDSVSAIIDSSFVETYSRHDEDGSEYFGYKKKNGFKLHQMIDHGTRLPLMQYATAGARSDIVWGMNLIRGAPAFWNIRELTADRAYDGAYFVHEIVEKWNGVAVGIPLRRHKPNDSWFNRFMKSWERTLTPSVLNKRSEIERYFSRKKRVFRLGEERTRGLQSFEANCYMTSIMEILEWSTKPEIWLLLFTKLSRG